MSDAKDWQVGVLRRAVDRIRSARRMIEAGEVELAVIRLEGLEVDLSWDARELKRFFENAEASGREANRPFAEPDGCRGDSE